MTLSLYILIGIATGLLVKADAEISEIDLMFTTYVIVGLFWFITIPVLLWNLSIRLIAFTLKSINK